MEPERNDRLRTVHISANFRDESKGSSASTRSSIEIVGLLKKINGEREIAYGQILA